MGERRSRSRVREEGNPILRARELRKLDVATEKKLWSHLRDRQLGGFKFRRQHPIRPYFADFYCAEARLVVESDGDSHSERVEYDERRTQYLESEGYAVIRFVNDDVHRHLDTVLEAILAACIARSTGPSP